MRKSLYIYTFILFLILAFQPIETAAQIPSFDDDVDDETPAAPIDGFILISLGIGACYGFKKKRI